MFKAGVHGRGVGKRIRLAESRRAVARGRLEALQSGAKLSRRVSKRTTW